MTKMISEGHTLLAWAHFPNATFQFPIGFVDDEQSPPLAQVSPLSSDRILPPQDSADWPPAARRLVQGAVCWTEAVVPGRRPLLPPQGVPPCPENKTKQEKPSCSPVTTVQRQNQPKCPYTADQRSEMWSLQIMEYFSALERNEVLTPNME